MRTDGALNDVAEGDTNAAHSFFQGASRLIRLSCSELNLYISSWGDTSKMLFASENDLSAVWDMASRDRPFVCHHLANQILCKRFRYILTVSSRPGRSSDRLPGSANFARQNAQVKANTCPKVTDRCYIDPRSKCLTVYLLFVIEVGSNIIYGDYYHPDSGGHQILGTDER